ADDDAAGAPRRPSVQAAPPPMQAAPVRALADEDRDFSDMLDDDEPLALSPSQIVGDEEDGDDVSFDAILADTESEAEAGAPELVEPEDVAFDAGDDLPSFDPLPPKAPEPEPVMESAPEPVMEQAAPELEPAPRPAPAEAAPLPDPTLTADIAGELLEPATRAAVRSSIGKLSALGIGNPGLTTAAMLRALMRPVLTGRLYDTLPSVVERMVEKGISRIARGA